MRLARILGEEVGQIVGAGVEALTDGLIQQALAHAGGQRIDGHDAARDLIRALALEHRVRHLPAQQIALGLAVKDVFLAGVERVFEVGLVEISQIERGRFVHNAKLDEVEPLADVRELRLGRDDGADTGVLAGDKVGDAPVLPPVLVGAGEVGDQLAQIGDAQLLERLGALLADALDVLDVGGHVRHDANFPL